MQSFFFGILQGLTEFLPVSSSGHLYLFQKIVGINVDLLPFFVLLHLATLLVVLIFFRREIWQVLCNRKLVMLAILVTLVTAVIGLLIKHFILARLINQGFFIALFFLFNSVILLTTPIDPAARKQNEFSLLDSVWLGFFQGVGVLPGISRSGITISTLIRRGFSASEAFNLSFVMGLPAILAAFALELPDLVTGQFKLVDLIFGFTAAFIFGILSLIFLKRSVLAKKFNLFGVYTLILALLVWWQKV